MSKDEIDSFEITKGAFASIEALVQDAVGNATLTGDRKRLHIGAGYLRLAAQKSTALPKRFRCCGVRRNLENPFPGTKGGLVIASYPDNAIGIYSSNCFSRTLLQDVCPIRDPRRYSGPSLRA